MKALGYLPSQNRFRGGTLLFVGIVVIYKRNQELRTRDSGLTNHLDFKRICNLRIFNKSELWVG